MALSPAGNQVAFVASQGGISQVYVRALDSPEAKPLPGTEGTYCTPIFSPDGQWLTFFVEGKLKKVSLQGGPPVTLANASGVNGVSWGSDDNIVFSDPSVGGLQKVPAAGGAPQMITTVNSGKGEIAHKWPAHLPGGKALLFAVLKGGRPDEAEIVAQRLDTGERKVLVQGGTYPGYVPTGHLVFVRAGTLMAVPFSLERLETTGAPAPVAENVMQSGQGAAEFSLSPFGSLVYVPGGKRSNGTVPVWVDRKGVAGQPLSGFPANLYSWPQISLDGQRLTVNNGGAAGGDIWIYDIPRATLTRLTFDTKSNSPRWSPDGRWIAYSAIGPEGSANLFRRLADGSGSEERLTKSKNAQQPSSWSPDGKLLAFQENHPSTGWDIWVLPLEGDRKPQPFLQTPFSELMPVFSPDGRWIAYVSDESGREEVYARPYPGPGEKRQISTEGGREPVWARNGELFYRLGNKIMGVQVATQPAFKAGAPRPFFEGPYFWFVYLPSFDVTADGERFLMLKSTDPPATEISVVLNWFEELKKRVPAGR